MIMSAYRLRGEVGGVPASFALVEGDNLVGSRMESEVVLAERGVSRRHALVRVRPGGIEVEDLGSKNGTRLNGKPVRTTAVHVADELRFGSVSLVLEEVASGDADLAVRLDGPAPEDAGGRTTQSESRQAERACGTWLSAIEKVGELLPRPVTEPGPPLRALALAAGAAGGAVVEWDGSGEPTIHTACGDPQVLRAVAQARQLFREVARIGTGEALSEVGEVGMAAAAVPGTDRPIGVVLVGPALPSGGGPALRAVARLLAGSTGLAPAGGEARPTPVLVFPDGHVAGESPAMTALYRQLRPLVDGDLPLLIVGETGAGKEHVARLIHASSRRARGPFVALNCAAIPAELLEAELFGIERGVATGVVEREGKLQQASGGVLLLDEIGDMAPALQAKLLRVLQEREVVPVGGKRSVPVDVGLIAATNTEPERLLAEGRFRPDLFYRIAGYVLRVPPLRERREDIPRLVEHFVRRFAGETGRAVRGVTVRAMDALIGYRWPGNVRELEHELRRLVYLCPHGQAIDSTLVPPRLAVQPVADPDDLRLETHVAATERVVILRALDRTGGNQTQAAKLLGISRNGLTLKLERLGISTGD
ncbi:MAG: sigma 54-interacting transcriptional regulator [Acidobacteria bacterium]|nr:sigma 54-interacting transcriptional regulator [Acidobacteriota bacterium]